MAGATDHTQQTETAQQVNALADDFMEWWLRPSTDPQGGKEAAGTLIARLRKIGEQMSSPPEVVQP